MEKKLITFKVIQPDHSKAVAKTSLGLISEMGPKEALLAYIIEQSENGKYYHHYGKISIAKKNLELSAGAYRKAFNTLLLMGAIIRLPNRQNSKYGYYTFHKTIKRLIR